MRYLGNDVDLRNGLSADQARISREKYSLNTLSPPQREPWWNKFIEKFDDPTIKILLAAAVISLLMTVLEKFVLGHPDANFVDSIGIFIAVLLATLCGFFSELKSEREFELLNKVKDEIKVKVLRDGQMCEISISEVLRGEIVHLDLGDKVPADGMVLEAMSLLVDQSVMTGESIPVEKQPHELRDSHDLEIDVEFLAKLDDRNLVYRGTMVEDGHGLFLVTEIGDRTRLGQIAATLGKDGESENETPLTQKLSLLAKQISLVGITGAMSIFAIMAALAIWNSPIFREFCAEFRCLNIVPGLTLVGISLVLNILGTRFCIRPFFKSMGIELKSLWPQLLLCIPLFIGCFGIGLGVYCITNSLNATEVVIIAPAEMEIPTGEISQDSTQWQPENLPMALAMDLLRNILTCFVIAVTIIVVAVPEGLPMMVTVSLALNMMKMARENCLVRKLLASETIGSATVVCTDKTGTLTQNRMKCSWAMLGLQEFNAENIETINKSQLWLQLIDSIAANSEAALHIEKTGTSEKIEGIGNPTECAMLRLLYDCGVDYREYRDKFQRIQELSHNSQRKLSLVLIEKPDDGKTCFTKGAPEILLARCSQVFTTNGESEPIERHLATIKAALDAASANALRVIAFTVKKYDNNCAENTDCEKCLECRSHTLLGLIGIADPIRPEVRVAVETARHAGVEIKMITGDAQTTAIAIAKQAGILSDSFSQNDENTSGNQNSELVLDSAALAAMDDRELLEAIPRLKVLARSSPMDKLRLVKAMHREGEVVAMTGDGTNDAPALKFADVGISMGITGTEVAKEASDIVLVDDNFKSIITGIWWGRTLYHNIQRFLQFQLSVNVVAMSCALLGPLVGIPLPLTVTQLLWINIIMDTFAAIALSCEPPRKNSMTRRPISRDASIITASMGVSILLNSLYQVVILFAALYFGWFLATENRYDFSTDPMGRGENLQALTVFFTIFIMFQFWHKFNCRSLGHNESPFELLHKNKLFLLIVGTITVVQILMVQGSDYFGIGRIFRTVTLSPSQWLEIALLTVTIIPVAWLVRKLVHRLGLESRENKT